MNQFQFLGEMLVNIDPCPAEKVYLLVKLLEVGSAFVVNNGIRYQADFKAKRMYADTEFDVLTQAG